MATLLFLVAAAAVLYACVRLVGSVARNSLRQDVRLPHAAASASPAPSSAPTESVFSVSAIQSPAPELSPSPDPADSPTPAATPTPPAASPTPAPTLLPVSDAGNFSEESIQLLLLMMDEDDHPDWIVAVSVCGDDCRILSIPRNALLKNGRTLAETHTGKACVAGLRQVWPIQYGVTVVAKLPGLPTFVDHFGGVQVRGETLDGAGAVDYLNSGPSDELLRIERQQAFMRAYLTRLQSVSLFSLVAARFAFEPYLTSNLSAAELMTLFDRVRNIDADAVVFHTLPVDSRMQDGVRCYAPDIPLVNQMAQNWTE